MKILIISGVFPPDIGGPASYVPVMARELSEKGHEAGVLCLSDSMDIDDSTYEFSVTRIKRGLFKPYRVIKTIIKIFNMLDKCDVAYVNGLGFEASIALMFRKKPSVNKVVGDFSWERARNNKWFDGTIDQYQSAHKSLTLKTLDCIRNFSLKHSHKIIVPSVYLRKIVTGWGIEEERVTVVYNAVENRESEKHYKLKEYDGKTIITVCRLVPRKGIGELVTIMTDMPDVRLVIVGDGPLHDKLKKLAAQFDVEGRVVFTGHISKDMIASLLKQSQCFVLNSTYEGLPHVVLEVMEAGTPVVAVDAGGTGEVVKNNINGLLVPPGDIQALKEAVIRILNDEKLAGRLAEHAKEMIKTGFSHSEMVRQTEYILKKAADTLKKGDGK